SSSTNITRLFWSSGTETRAYDEIRLLLRWGPCRRLLGHAEPARWQRLRTGGNDQPRHSRAARIHRDDAGLGSLQPIRARVARGAVGADPRKPPAGRVRRGRRIRRPQTAPPRVGPLGRPRIDARDDGDDPQSRLE